MDTDRPDGPSKFMTNHVIVYVRGEIGIGLNMSDVLNRRRKAIYSAQKVKQNQAAITFGQDEKHVVVKDWMHEHEYEKLVHRVFPKDHLCT